MSNPKRYPSIENEMAPARGHFLIVPSDSDPLPIQPKAIYVAADGDAVLKTADGTEITYSLTAGQILPLRVTAVLETGTTAFLIGWY